MKEIRVFEVGEEVYVKATVTGMSVDNGEIKYHLKNEITGRSYDHLFTGDQMFPIVPIVKNTAPVTNGNNKFQKGENYGRKSDQH